MSLKYYGKEIQKHSTKISGSTLTVDLGADTGSTAIFTNNIQTGYPTSNRWKQNLDGSYLNRFDNTTNVSEILRFMAGVLSASLDTRDSEPNKKTYGSIDTNENNLGLTDSINGNLPMNHTSIGNNTLNYLANKQWVISGSSIFNGISVYHDNPTTYTIDFDSNSSGTSTVSSSADSELFGLGGLSSGGASNFSVNIIGTQSFSDTGSISTPTAASNTHTTQSFLTLSTTSFGTSNGLTLTKIETSQPAVIPAGFQDGKFVDVGGATMDGTLTRKYHASKTSFTSVSSSGYYNFHDMKVGIKSGSQSDFTYKNGTDKNRFWAPIDQIETDLGTNTLADSETITRSLTAISRSLSGAPYLSGSTYEISTKISGLFNPLYAASTTLVDLAASSVGVGSVTLSNDSISTSGGKVQTSGSTLETAVYANDLSKTRDTNEIPHYNDLAIVSASIVFRGGSDDNVNQSGLGDTSFDVLTKGRNRNSSQSTLDTQNINYHTAGTFGQSVASGSMAVYGRIQGYDGGSLTGTTETFSGESYRIKLLDNVLAFNGTAFDTTFTREDLGTYDLQVKPGFLVDPGGSYRYWYALNYHSSATYKYYIRRFQTSGTKTSMTLNVGATLVNWDSTTNGVAAAIIFKSSTSAGVTTSISTARLYDPSETTSNLIESGVTADNFKNPFSSNLDLYGNTGGSLDSNTYTMPLRSADGMFLNANDNELYVLIRYKGDPTPITSITLGFS